MHNKKVMVMAMGIVFVFAMAFFLVAQEVQNAQECRIIRVHGGGAIWSDRIELEPGTSFIAKGTCVIWNNWVRTDEIKIIFDDGKKCDDMTDASVGFTLDAAN